MKPDNVFITNDGRVKILDFGIAKLTRASDDGAAANRPHDRHGRRLCGRDSRLHVAEQVRGDAVDGRSDIFSLGTILDEVRRSGRPAFTRESTAETMAAILKEDRPSPFCPGSRRRSNG